jgi:hypothetical protein
LDITLDNLLANPTSDGQSVSEFFIAGLTGTPVLESSFAQEGTPPSSNVSPRPGGTGWGFGASGTGYELCIVCLGPVSPPGKSAPPSLLIIGPPDEGGQYSNANASIYVHSPFLFQEATFHLTGVTNAPIDSTGVPFSNVKMGFGTQAVQLSGNVFTQAEVPEPGAWLLVVGGLTMIYVARKGMQRTRRARELAGRKE